MYYLKVKSTGSINWANAYKTEYEALIDLLEFGSIEDWEIEYHDKGIYFASMNGDIFHSGFKSREEAIEWAYNMFGDSIVWDFEYETYDVYLADGNIIMLDLIGDVVLN
ncbi:MAG: hypothetical protein ACRCYT_04935 [Cetobacterium sp.]